MRGAGLFAVDNSDAICRRAHIDSLMYKKEQFNYAVKVGHDRLTLVLARPENFCE
jgi:hypothetical protein